jgi:hypothetical protein
MGVLLFCPGARHHTQPFSIEMEFENFFAQAALEL